MSMLPISTCWFCSRLDSWSGHILAISTYSVVNCSRSWERLYSRSSPAQPTYWVLFLFLAWIQPRWGFALGGLTIAFAIFRLRFMDLLPIARQKVFESMPDGVIVLDKQNRIVDINPAAQHFMLIDPRDAIGQPVMDFLPKVLAGLFDPTGRNIASYEILAPDQKTQVNVYATPLSAKGREAPGTLITLQDITARKKTEIKLQESNIQLQKEIQQN